MFLSPYLVNTDSGQQHTVEHNCCDYVFDNSYPLAFELGDFDRLHQSATIHHNVSEPFQQSSAFEFLAVDGIELYYHLDYSASYYAIRYWVAHHVSV